MPYKTEKKALKDPFLDKRVKLLPCQKERLVQMHKEGTSQRALAKMFRISRRLVQFTVFPEKLEQNKKARKERGGWAQYYDKSKHKGYMKAHRKHKHNTLKDI